MTIWVNGSNNTLNVKSRSNFAQIRKRLGNELDLDSVGKNPPSKYKWAMYPNNLDQKDPLEPITTLEQFTNLKDKGIFIFRKTIS